MCFIFYLKVSDAVCLLEEGKFEEGTMAPKIRAAVDFVGDSAVRKAIITKLDPSTHTVGGQSGTMIGK